MPSNFIALNRLVVLSASLVQMQGHLHLLSMPRWTVNIEQKVKTKLSLKLYWSSILSNNELSK